MIFFFSLEKTEYSDKKNSKQTFTLQALMHQHQYKLRGTMKQGMLKVALKSND